MLAPFQFGVLLSSLTFFRLTAPKHISIDLDCEAAVQLAFHGVLVRTYCRTTASASHLIIRHEFSPLHTTKHIHDPGVLACAVCDAFLVADHAVDYRMTALLDLDE